MLYHIHSLQTLPHQETNSVVTPPTTTPTSVINEESSGETSIEFVGTWPSNARDWKKRQLRRAQPVRLFKENGVHGHQDVPVRTKGESTRNMPTNEGELLQRDASESNDLNKDRCVGAVDHMIKTVVTPPNTDPLHRRATRGTEDDEEGVASGASKHTNYLNLTPVHMRSKSKGHKVDEPDGGLGSYIAQLRARGHQRSTSAPIRDRVKATPAHAMDVAMTSSKVESKETDSSGERKVILLSEPVTTYMS